MRHLNVILSLGALLLGGCEREEVLIVESDDNFANVTAWEHVLSQEQIPLHAPPEITWDVDAAACGTRTGDIVKGMTAAGHFWETGTTSTVRQSSTSPTLYVTCADFEKNLMVNKQPWFIRGLEADRSGEVKHMIVEIPSNYAICENDPDECRQYSKFRISRVGVSLNVIGLVYGVRYAIGTGDVPRLNDIGGISQAK